MENTNQFYDLSEAQMLQLWKQVSHLETPRRDCVVEWDDGIDMDALLLTHIKQWYAHLLNTAPAALLPTEDVKDELRLDVGSSGMVITSLPSRCVRPVSVKLSSWKQCVTQFLDPCSHEAMLQLNEWTRGGDCCPAIIDYGFQLLMTAGQQSQPIVEMALAVVRPADGSYRFHASLLSTIPTWESGAA